MRSGSGTAGRRPRSPAGARVAPRSALRRVPAAPQAAYDGRTAAAGVRRAVAPRATAAEAPRGGADEPCAAGRTRSRTCLPPTTETVAAAAPRSAARSGGPDPAGAGRRGRRAAPPAGRAARRKAAGRPRRAAAGRRHGRGAGAGVRGGHRRLGGARDGPLSRVEARRAARARKDSPGVVASRAIGEVFITIGVLMLLFVTYQLWWTNVRAHAAGGQGDRATSRTTGRSGEREPGAFEPGQGFAILHIPKLDVVVPIAEGISKHEGARPRHGRPLRRGQAEDGDAGTRRATSRSPGTATPMASRSATSTG